MMNDRELVNFNDATISRRGYHNASLKKEPLFLDGDYFLLKYPERNRKITHEFQVSSYQNNAISEFVGCHIFESVGIDTQETFIAERGGELGVACRDFVDRDKGYELQEFGDLANRYFSSAELGRVPSLEMINHVYDNHETLKNITEKAKARYWDTFVMDALIGNPDRHVGNWGFLVNQNSTEVLLAPVYDCGSSLYARIDDLKVEKLLHSPKDIDMLVKKVPAGKIVYQDRKFTYSEAFDLHDLSDCQAALTRVFPKIDMGKIGEIIRTTPTISPERIELLEKITTLRYEQILEPAYMRAIEVIKTGKRDSKIEFIPSSVGKETEKAKPPQRGIDHEPEL